MQNASRPLSDKALPPGLFLKLLLPFVLPFPLVLLLIFTVGEAWPRSIAPGSGLKLTGFVVSALTAACAWYSAVQSVTDERTRTFAMLFCAITGLMGWPMWTVGVLPSINGARLEPSSTTAMRIERLYITRPSKGRGFHHWAVLETRNADALIESGRYFIPQSRYEEWRMHRPETVKVVHARGALGAEVVTAFR